MIAVFDILPSVKRAASHCQNAKRGGLPMNNNCGDDQQRKKDWQ
jgi:hypothetical protein